MVVERDDPSAGRAQCLVATLRHEVARWIVFALRQSTWRHVSNEERIDFLLSATEWAGSVSNREPDKCSELHWCILDALPENTIPYMRAALENFRQGRWFAEFGWHTHKAI